MNLIEYSKKLGLTKQESAMFELLLKEGPLTAKQIASKILCLPNAVYRTGRKLELKHYITISTKLPRLFHAVNLEVALELNKQENESNYKNILKDLVGSEGPNNKDSSQIEILAGRQALYDRYIDEARLSKTEILIFAIGIAYSEELEDVQRKAIARKVEIRHIVQKKDPSNYYVINKWLKLGIKMRYYPSPIGFHIMIFDSKIVILSISNPTDTDERTSLVFNSLTASQTLRDYFFKLWGSSQLVR